MADKRGRRAWIKVQLSDSRVAHEAAALVQEWKTARQAAGNLVKAVHLYAALCRGDVGPLYEFFPGLGLALASRPAVSYKPPSSGPTVIPTERSEAKALDEALAGLGLADLDFGQERAFAN